MLILAAAEDECILIGDSIEIKVVGFGHCPKGKTARLGITAPREIPGPLPCKLLIQEKQVSFRRKDYAVDNVNDTVRSFNVSNDDLHSLVQEDLAIFYADGHIFAQNCLGASQLDHIGSHDFARYDMVEQDVG